MVFLRRPRKVFLHEWVTMKRCSKCERTYDESLTFCLVDGTVLSAPFDPQATLQNTVRSTSEPPPTEVLRQQPEVKPVTVKSQPWFLYFSIAFALVVLFVVGIAWISWFVANSKTRSRSDSSDSPSTSPITPRQSPTPVAIDISGAWRDAYGNTSQITQSGATFNMTGSGTACRGRYVATSTGTISSSRIEMTYETNYSRGQCQGTISPGGSRITSTCIDSVCGQFLSVAQKVDE